MKKLIVFTLFITIMILWIKFGFTQEKSFQELANRIVNVSSNVNPGDVVVVYGGTHTIPLMEMMTIEAYKAGGMANMFLTSDRVDRAYFHDVDEKYLRQKPLYLAEWLKNIDIWISLPGNQDTKAIYADLSEERLAMIYEASQFINNQLNEMGIRVINIGYPTKEQASNYNLDFSVYEKMQWDAINADYKQISQNGSKIIDRLKGSKTVKVTSPSGTNFSFSVGDRPIYLDDGIVTEAEAKGKLFFARYASLPGGSIFMAPLETSANGSVNIPKTQCKFEPFTSISFEFKNGKLQNFKADKGAKCFKETM